MGIDLQMKHFIIKFVEAGIARKRAMKGEHQRIRHPISLVMLKQGLSIDPEWREGGKATTMKLGFILFF